MRIATATALILSGTLALSQQAVACSIVPGPPPPPPPREVIDQGARRLFSESDYLAQVVVVRAPRPRLNGETENPPPGLLRVEASIKGRPPSMIEVPLPDPCLFYFQRVGERAVVVMDGPPYQPLPLSPATVASLRRQGLGNWGAAR